MTDFKIQLFVLLTDNSSLVSQQHLPDIQKIIWKSVYMWLAHDIVEKTQDE